MEMKLLSYTRVFERFEKFGAGLKSLMMTQP